jgi:hypothetical protein
MALAALCYLLVTALLFRNLLPVLTTDLFGDLGDPLLNTAILAWNARHLPLTAEWWNFPSFAPLSGVTAFTEHLLGAYPLTSPVIWVTGNPVLAYNVLELACLTLNGVATYALVRELTGSKAGAFVGGLAFAFAPFVGEHVTHIQMLMAYGMPFALLGLHRYVEEGQLRHLAWFAFGWLDVLVSNAYLLVFFPILVALWAAWFFTREDARRWVAIAVAAIVVTLPVVPLLLGYRTRQAAYGLIRGVDEIQGWSATLASIAGISHRSVLWRGWLPDTFDERSLFPGFAIAALALVGAITTRRRVPLFYAAAAVVMWLFALGPERGPYWLLLHLPGAQSIRVPARAWLPATVCLAVCAGFGAAWLAGRGRARWLIAPLTLLIVAEAWFVGPTMKAPAAVKLAVPADAMVLDLPISAGYGNADAQYLAVLGNYRVVNGYSGYSLPYFATLRDALAAHRPEALAPFRALADLYVVVRPDLEKPFVTWLEMQRGVERLPDADAWKVYRLPRDGSGPPPRLPLPLPKHGENAISIPQ